MSLAPSVMNSEPIPTLSRARTEEMKRRTKQLALIAVLLSQQLPRTPEGRILTDQLIRSATSVAANYRAVCRSRSKREFIAKLSIVVEECDETIFWLELLIEIPLLPPEAAHGAIAEAGELLAIFVASRKTAQRQSG